MEAEPGESTPPSPCLKPNQAVEAGVVLTSEETDGGLAACLHGMAVQPPRCV